MFFISTAMTMSSEASVPKICIFQWAKAGCNPDECKDYCNTQIHGVGNCMKIGSEFQCMCKYACPPKVII